MRLMWVWLTKCQLRQTRQLVLQNHTERPSIHQLNSRQQENPPLHHYNLISYTQFKCLSQLVNNSHCYTISVHNSVHTARVHQMHNSERLTTLQSRLSVFVPSFVPWCSLIKAAKTTCRVLSTTQDANSHQLLDNTVHTKGTATFLQQFCSTTHEIQ